MDVIGQETIAAIATARGRGGVAIIRISGPNVINLTQTFFKTSLTPRYAHYLPFYDDNNEILDQGLALLFPAPHSFTGEDVLEFHGHGGTIIADLVLKSVLKQSVRLAKPGEFSERAFLNGKIDLVQAEAIADLIEASSTDAARSVMRSLQGEFSQAIHAINDDIIRLRMFIEASIDFGDEDIELLSQHNIAERGQLIAMCIKEIIESAQQGSILREGLHVVITGAPNVGKSSLLNALSRKEVAIISDIPGTTRDVIGHAINLDGIPVHLVDTAGLRESADLIEQEGIRRAHQEISQADLILLVNDIRETVVIPETLITEKTILVLNKSDLTAHAPPYPPSISTVAISVKTRSGLDTLKALIKEKVGIHNSNESVFLARTRHLEALQKAYRHAQQSIEFLNDAVHLELAAEELRLAHVALGEITGVFSTDDLLGEIFSNFCIGK